MLMLLLAAAVLLAAFAGGGAVAGGRAGAGRAAKAFVALWLVAMLVNLYIGVVKAGFSLMLEIAVFALVFGVPALAAREVWRRAGGGR